MTKSERWVAAGLLGLALVVYVVHAWSFGLCLQDDAFISLRYARNFALGHGLVYNVGERVEGYTNFTWTVASAAPFLVGIDPGGFLRVLGLLSGVGAVFAAVLLARSLVPEEPLAPPLAAVTTAGLPFLVGESVMGLETALFAALGCAAFALYLREREHEPARRPWSGPVLALAALTRPEGVLLAAVIGCWDLADAVARRRIGRSALVRWAAFVVPVVLHAAFRLAFYGDLLPNTFYAKVGGGWASLERGLAYTLEFLLAAAPLVVCGAIGIVLVLRGRRRAAAPVLITLGVFLAYVAYVGGDYKPTFRFFALPGAVLAAFAGIGLARASRAVGSKPAVANAAALVLACALAWANIALGSEARDFGRWRAEQLPVHRAAGRWLKQHIPAGTWIATGNAGVLPYDSELPNIDMYGLCDRHIARRELPKMGAGPAGHEKGDGAYVLSRAPRIILFQFARFTDQPLAPEAVRDLRMSVSEVELWADPRFHELYELRSARLPGFYFNYFERKDRS